MPAVSTMPRLTRRMTAESIARETGGNVSKILADLDRRSGKRERANVNPVQTMEFAVRQAVDKLGAKKVAEMLGIGEATLRKAVNPNEPHRVLDEAKVPLSGIRRVMKALKVGGHAEFFTAALQAEMGDGSEAVEHLPSIHHALSLATATRGKVARLLVDAFDGVRRPTSADLAEVDEAITLDIRALTVLREQLLAEVKKVSS